MDNTTLTPISFFFFFALIDNPIGKRKPAYSQVWNSVIESSQLEIIGSIFKLIEARKKGDQADIKDKHS